MEKGSRIRHLGCILVFFPACLSAKDTLSAWLQTYFIMADLGNRVRKTGRPGKAEVSHSFVCCLKISWLVSCAKTRDARFFYLPPNSSLLLSILLRLYCPSLSSTDKGEETFLASPYTNKHTHTPMQKRLGIGTCMVTFRGRIWIIESFVSKELEQNR